MVAAAAPSRLRTCKVHKYPDASVRVFDKQSLPTRELLGRWAKGQLWLARATPRYLYVFCNAFCGWQTSLDQVCSKHEGSEQPFAFKDLMIHLILQFTLHIAFRGVLHRCENPEIHR